jgi:UDP-2,3-diacylglucosamine pyrophosphatase LpxH
VKIEGIRVMIFFDKRNIIYKLLVLGSVLMLQGELLAQKRSIKLIHTSDIHTVFQLKDSNPDFFKLRKNLLGNGDSLKTFFKTVPQKYDADAVVITGDLIDYFAAYKVEGSAEKVEFQVEQFAALAEECPVPLYMTLGNHDLTTYWIDKKDSTKRQTQVLADMARASFIRNIPCFKHGTYYHKEYKVGKTNYHLFFLDNGNSIPKDWLDLTQLKWFENELKKVGNEPVIIFQHKYFVIGDINGDGVYFKKDKKTDWPKEDDCKSGFMEVLNEHANIKAIFLGHGHENVWEDITFPAGHKIYQIETGTLYKNKNNWRTINLTEDAIVVDKPGSNEIELEIK